VIYKANGGVDLPLSHYGGIKYCSIDNVQLKILSLVRPIYDS